MRHIRITGATGGDGRRGDGPCGERGFSLLEAVFATVLVAGGLAGVAQLVLVAIAVNHSSGTTTTTTALASQKMEELGGLAFYTDEGGRAVTDSASDLTVTPAAPIGGRGLQPSPPDALSANTPGYVDYLGVSGQWVGTGADTPREAVFVRRWSVIPLPAHPDNALILQVYVAKAPAASRGVFRQPGAAAVVSLRARKSR